MSADIAKGKGASYRAESEALHHDTSTHRKYYDNLVMLHRCGYGSLIRQDFYGLVSLTPDSDAAILDAGCGTGVETVNFRRMAPMARVHGVDVSSVALAEAVARPGNAGVVFHQSTLEALPFNDRSFQLVTSHEVIEHVEDPAVVLAEFYRVLVPGGVCVIATPNGASLCIEHLRQRIMRLMGKRGAPVGSDHVRPPSFWRRQFRRAGFVIERQLYDGAALEFQTYILPARWMKVSSRLLEPLRVVPLFNWLICDRVKYRLSKPRAAVAPMAGQDPACPICGGALAAAAGRMSCGQGHGFAINSFGLIDFTQAMGGASSGRVEEEGQVKAPVAPPHPVLRWARRLLTLAYAGVLVVSVPVGMVARWRHDPFRDIDPEAWQV